MRIVIAFWMAMYALIGIALGARYFESRQPLFESDVAVLTAANIGQLELTGELPGSRFEIPFFDPHNRLIMVANSRVRIFDLTSGKHLGDLYTDPTCNGLNRLFGCIDLYAPYSTTSALSDDGAYLAMATLGYFGQEIRVWHMQTGEFVETISLQSSNTSTVVFFPNSHTLLYTYPQQGLWRFNADTRILQQVDTDNVQQVLSVTDERVFYATTNNLVKSVGEGWQVEVSSTPTGVSGLSVALVSPDGRYLVSQLANNDLQLHNLASGTVRALVSHQQPVSAIVFSTNMHHMFSADLDGTLIQWDVASGDVLWRYEQRQAGQWSLVVGKQDDILIAQNWAGLSAWDITSGTRLLDIEFDSPVSTNTMYISPDGRFLVTQDGRIYGVRK